jgi:hypothetical protein
MKRFGLAVANLALVVTMLVCAPAVLAQHKATKHNPLPDLIVTGISTHVPGTGSTPYVQVYPNGSTTPFDVHVDVENIGNAPAPKNLLRVQFFLYGLKRYPTVPALAPKQHATVVIIMHHVKLSPHLLFFRLEPVAVVNYNFHVPEQHYTNNQATGDSVPVIAHQWKIAVWSTHETQAYQGGTIDHTDLMLPGGNFLVFHSYDRLDKIFFYSVYGDIQSNTSFTSPNCSGSGQGFADERPWPTSSEFGISYDQTHYRGSVDTSLEDPYTVTINCTNPNVTEQTQIRLNDLQTNTGHPGLVSGPNTKKQMSNSGTVPIPMGSVTYMWKFNADVP